MTHYSFFFFASGQWYNCFTLRLQLPMAVRICILCDAVGCINAGLQ